MRKILCIVLAFAICSMSIFSYVYAENEENQTTDQCFLYETRILL